MSHYSINTITRDSIIKRNWYYNIFILFIIIFGLYIK